MAEAAPHKEDRQFGPYRLTQMIATGGMAEIHLAMTRGIEGFEKYVALKMIHPNFSSDDHFVQMLIDEAKISVQLQHANIAHVFDLGKVGDTYYIAMEFVDGVDLFKILRKASEQDRYMPVETACYIAKEVCAGLDYAHHKRDSAGRSMGIVHRDVSPQNVLISHSGEVKLVDFGIAKATMRAKQTAVGVIKGKYYYMSPEQAWGDPVDHRTDIFSAGILLYEMLTGQMLYLEEDMNKLLDMVRKAEIAPPSTKRPEVPRDLDRIVMRALAKKPDLRWQSAQDFGTAIERFLHGHAPDFSAQRLASFLHEVIPAPQPAPAPPEPAKVERAVARPAMSRSEFTDENSVIFRLKDVSDLPRGAPPPTPPRAPVSPNRLTTPAALPPPKRPVAPNRVTSPSSPAPPRPPPIPKPTVEETRAPKTLVSAPGFASLDAGTIELREDMLMPLDEPTETSDKTEDAAVPPPVVTSDHTAEKLAPPPAAPAPASAPASAPPPAPAPARVTAPRHAEVPRTTAPLPLSAPLEDSAPQPALRPSAAAASVWPPVSGGSGGWTDDDSGVKIGRKLVGRRQLYLLVAALGVALVIGALGVAIFSDGRGERDFATLEVISIPAGARISVDGRVAGMTPATIDHIALDRPVTIRLDLDRFEPWQRTETMSEPRDLKVVASLKPILATLQVDSTPVGAEVFLDNRSLGRTPLTRSDMNPFTDGTIEVRKQGYKPSRQGLKWEGRREAQLKVELAPAAN